MNNFLPKIIYHKTKNLCNNIFVLKLKYLLDTTNSLVPKFMSLCLWSNYVFRRLESLNNNSQYITFSCSVILQEETTDVNFTISREAFARNGTNPKAKYNFVIKDKNNLVSLEMYKKPFLNNQGEIANESISFNEKTFNKTTERVIIPQGQIAQIYMRDDTVWSTYYNKEYFDSYRRMTYFGAFIKDRNITLNPFIIGAYEVIQELYEEVMGSNPSEYKENPATSETGNLLLEEETQQYLSGNMHILVCKQQITK